MGSVVMALLCLLCCTCVYMAMAQGWDGYGRGWDNGDGRGRDNGDHRNGDRNGRERDDRYDADDWEDNRCRCASYCSPNEYFAGTCRVWWRQNYCCRIRTSGHHGQGSFRYM